MALAGPAYWSIFDINAGGLPELHRRNQMQEDLKKGFRCAVAESLRKAVDIASSCIGLIW
jgi:hypothetical protein